MPGQQILYNARLCDVVLLYSCSFPWHQLAPFACMVATYMSECHSVRVSQSSTVFSIPLCNAKAWVLSLNSLIGLIIASYEEPFSLHM